MLRRVLACIGVVVSCGCIAVAYPGEEILTVQGSATNAGDQFGSSMVVSGDLAIVGANIGGGTEALDIYIFDMSDPVNPVELSKIDVGGPVNQRSSLAVDGGMLAIGSPGEFHNGEKTGAAYLFDISDPANPVFRSKVVASDGLSGDVFGHDIAISGTKMAVTALFDTTSAGPFSSSMYVFDISDPVNPVETAHLIPDFGQLAFYIGPILMRGDVLAIGIPNGRNGNGVRTGYVQRLDLSDPANPVEIDPIEPPTEQADQKFGWEIAWEGDTLAVSAADFWVSGVLGRGRVYLYDMADPVNPVHYSTLRQRDSVAQLTFGTSIAIAGDYVVVGSPDGDVPDANHIGGAAYVFHVLNPSNPTLLGPVYPQSGASRNSDYGKEVAMFGDKMVACAPRNVGGMMFVHEAHLCQGDANYDDVIDVNDVVYVLFRLGEDAPRADVIYDGTVDVTDISGVLFNLGNPCP